VQPVYGDGLTELRGHPVGFGRVCLDKLLKLEGNKGAAVVLIAYNAIKLIVSDIGVITDIDTVDDLARAQTLLKSRSFTIGAGF
jgi:molybdenum cofactor cytidylyltransferase